jgi:pyridinium-3,5-biscarboxylic acid mononucleotide sulfurtransferase
MNKEEKLNTLKRLLSESGNAVIALSGGTDSTFLAFTASKIKDLNLLAVIVNSPYMFAGEIKDAIEFCTENNISYKEVRMGIPDTVKDNPPERCYLCKKEVMKLIRGQAVEAGMNQIFDGTNADDVGDYRPGMKALSELGIRSPLLEADLSKTEIRDLAREADLKIWNKPSNACLMTRFPHHTSITENDLRKAEAAELVLDRLGLPGSRVRVHNEIARIECRKEHFPLLIIEELRNRLAAEIKKLGYKYVTIDLEGYRTGSMNLKMNID